MRIDIRQLILKLLAMSLPCYFVSHKNSAQNYDICYRLSAIHKYKPEGRLLNRLVYSLLPDNHKMKYLLFFSQLILLTACTEDMLPEPEPSMCDGLMPTYETDIRPIIEASCAYSGCHLGGGGGGQPNYEGYEDLLPDIENGTFRDRVILRQADENVGMPPNYAPDGRPQDLTADEILLMECWLEAGYPEN